MRQGPAIWSEGVETGEQVPALRWEQRALPQVLITGRSLTTSAFRIPLYRLPHHGLNYLSAGQQDGLLNGRHHRMEGGTLHAFRAGDSYVGHFAGGPFDCRYATFTWPVAEGRGEMLLPRQVRVPSRQAGAVGDLCDALHAARQSADPGSPLRASGLLLQLFGVIQALAQTTDEELPRPIAAVLAHAEAHLEQALTIDALARVAGWSADRLRRSFRRATGTSLHQHLIQRRMRRARTLLEQTADLPIAAVARRCGFADPKHFCRTVTRWWGCSPRALRQGRRLPVPVAPAAPRAVSSRARDR